MDNNKEEAPKFYPVLVHTALLPTIPNIKSLRFSWTVYLWTFYQNHTYIHTTYIHECMYTYCIVRFQSGIFGLYNSNSINNWGCTVAQNHVVWVQNRYYNIKKQALSSFITFAFTVHTCSLFHLLFRKKIFFQSSTFFTFFTFLIFSKINPKYFPSVDLVA